MQKDNFRLFIQEKNIIDNINYLKAKKNSEILPVLKANAYGHGIKNIVDILYNNGQKDCVVARVREAYEILKTNNFPEIKILVLENIKELNQVKDIENIEVTINSLEQLKFAKEINFPENRMHLKLDFGFGRNGFLEEEFLELTQFISEKNINFKGVATHLFSASKNDGKEIIEKFSLFIKELGRERFEKIHFHNSSSIYEHNSELATHIRPGMLIYGLQEPGYHDTNLKQVISLRGEVSDIKSVSKNKYLAYMEKEIKENKNFEKIAKLKIGYGDGFLKKNEQGKCLINNKEYLIEQITMDNTFVYVDENVQVGDKVELYYNYIETVNHLDMKFQEALILLSDRLERVVI